MSASSQGNLSKRIFRMLGCKAGYIFSLWIMKLKFIKTLIEEELLLRLAIINQSQPTGFW